MPEHSLGSGDATSIEVQGGLAPTNAVLVYVKWVEHFFPGVSSSVLCHWQPIQGITTEDRIFIQETPRISVLKRSL